VHKDFDGSTESLVYYVTTVLATEVGTYVPRLLVGGRQAKSQRPASLILTKRGDSRRKLPTKILISGNIVADGKELGK
jgi:hypothetical protein